MLLINNGTNPYSHKGFVLPKGKKIEVPDNIAEELLKIAGVEKYIRQEDLKKAEKEAQAKAKAEREALEKELADTKAELEKLKEAQAKAKAEKEDKTLEELKKEADELGVEYPSNIGAAKLKERIEAKKSQDNQK